MAVGIPEIFFAARLGEDLGPYRGIDGRHRLCHPAPVLKRLGKFAIVLALVCVVGGHWALLQSLAWVSMAIDFSRTDALDAAIEKTFNGQNPCHLCHFVAEGKKSERAKEIFKPATKLELISSTAFSLPAPSENSIELALLLATARSRADAPPFPPPRFA